MIVEAQNYVGFFFWEKTRTYDWCFFKGNGKIIESKSNWKQKPSHGD